jgi:hypothetical protein
LKPKENRSSFISELSGSGCDGNIAGIQVNAFWTRVTMPPLNGTKRVKVMFDEDYGIGCMSMLEEMRA